MSNPDLDNIIARWSPDGERVACYTREHVGEGVVIGISLIEPDGQFRCPYEATPEHPIETGPVWSPDGKRLAWMEAKCEDEANHRYTEKRLVLLTLADNQVERFDLDDAVQLVFDWR